MAGSSRSSKGSGITVRVGGLLLFVVLGLVWTCAQLLLQLPGNSHADERVKELERQIEELQLEARRWAPSGSPADAALQEENALLKRKIDELQRDLSALRTNQAAKLKSSHEAERLARGQKAPQGQAAATAVASDGRAAAGFLAPGAQADSAHHSGRRITEDDLRRWAMRPGTVGTVMISCKRPKYLERAMTTILRARPDPERFPMVISQDGHDKAMDEAVTAKYTDTGLAFHIHHDHDPKAESIARRFGGGRSNLGYVYIAQHYGFAMTQMFDKFGFEQIIILEEDLEVSPDFFTYFAAMLPMLTQDPDLYCVSAWNDNGYDTLVSDPKVAYRTEFFGGLGWMTTKSFWNEVRDRWPNAFWDEFMRRPDVRHDRHCIRPDISRTFTFGEEGVSNGQFFSQHLSRIKLNDVAVDWAHEDLHHLGSKSSFDTYLAGRIRDATKVAEAKLVASAAGDSVRLEYDDKEYKRVADFFNLMQDEKEGIRRMSYKGVIPFSWRGKSVFLHTRNWPDLRGGISQVV